MTALIVLIPVSIGMGVVGLCAFIWALHHEQFDDPEGSAWRVIGMREPENKEGMHNDHLATQAEDSAPSARV